jgi:hypothetical protein
VLVASHIPVNSGAGTVSLGPGTGSNDGVQGIDCQGATPTSGLDLPAQVVTDLQATATVLRILHNDGTGLVGAVEVNCTIDSQSPTVIQRFRSLSRTK